MELTEDGMVFGSSGWSSRRWERRTAEEHGGPQVEGLDS
jgi:hypothetical protein